MSYSAKDLETLRLQAQQIQQALAARQAADRQQYARQQAALNTDKENALRQAYVSQQQALAQLPGQLQAAGINGGAAESSLVRLARAYGNARGDILAGYNADMADLRAAQAANEADHAAAAAQDRASYLGAWSALQQAAAKRKTTVLPDGQPQPDKQQPASTRGSGGPNRSNRVHLVR